MKLSRRTAMLTAASAAVAQPAFAQKSADTLRIQFVDAVPNVDMYFNSQRTGLILAHQAWDMLVHRDPTNFEIKPSLATDWKFAEDNSLDLTIRQGVKFHDGSTLSPDDVVYTINMAANPESKVATPSNYAWIDKAEKTGDWTVRIHMKRPTPAALEYLAMVTPIHPKAYREKVGPEGFAAKPVGAGPYKIVKNEQGKEVVFERFEDYWTGSPKGKPAIKTLHVRFVPELATEVTELLAQQTDWIWNINPDQIASVNKMPHLQAVQQESMRIGYLSIDAAGRSGAGNPADQPQGAPGDLARHQSPGDGRQADPGRQPRADGAVLPDAVRLRCRCRGEVRLRSGQGQGAARRGGLSQRLRDRVPDLRAADVVERRRSRTTFRRSASAPRSTRCRWRRRSRRRGAARRRSITQSWGSYSINDVSAIFPVMYGKDANDNYSRDPELEKLVAEGGASSDPAVRKKAYSAAIKLMTEKAYWMPLFTYVNAYAFAKELDFKTYPDELPRFYFAKWK